jgi:anti-anti-sigma regulatory factor
MNNFISCRNSISTPQTATTRCGAGELVRGKEERLVERLTPLVCSRSLVLDLGAAERIDAAGVSALIRLSCSAYEAGHRFTVVNPRPRVAEVLALLRLNEILFAQDAESMPHFDLQAVPDAA